MVSFNTILTLGALIVGFVVLTASGGPSGLGTKIGAGIGGGFKQFSSSLASAFTGGLFGGNAGAANVANVEGTNTGSTNQPQTGGANFADAALDRINPIKSQLAIFQTIIDSLKDIGNFGQGAFGSTPLTSSQRTTSFAISQLRKGQTVRDITVKPKQGMAVSRTGQRVVVNLGGRSRVFGSEASAASFVERFNR